MKKNIFRGLLLSAVSVAGLTSCLEDVGNRFTLNNMMCTVVSNSSSRVVVQMDATQAYYFADEFLNKDMEIGDRYLLQKLTVNNDEQPAGATGAINTPILMTEVSTEKVDTKPFIMESVEDPTLANDSVELFYSPYIIRSKTSYNTYTYITFSGAVLKKADPDFRLVFTGRIEDANNKGKDTLCYEFKATNLKEGEKGVYESYAQCFNLDPMPSEQIVKIYYYGKRYQGSETNKITKSYCIIEAPKIYSE